VGGVVGPIFKYTNYNNTRFIPRSVPTHPVRQIQWTWEKNNKCDGHYVNVVKAIKWSHRFMGSDSKYPKGYPLEHIIGVCCPDAITSVADGVTMAFSNIVTRFAADVAAGKTLVLQDHGVPSHNVLHRLTPEDFKKFHEYCAVASEITKRASDAVTVFESANAWRELFGNELPAPSSDDRGSGGFTPRKTVSAVGGGRFA
jgi:hypothetical protein